MRTITHNKVYEYFKLYFPQYSADVSMWFPNGKNSVRVRVLRDNNSQDFVFTYGGKTNWCFETVNSHIKKMLKKGEK